MTEENADIVEENSNIMDSRAILAAYEAGDDYYALENIYIEDTDKEEDARWDNSMDSDTRLTAYEAGDESYDSEDSNVEDINKKEDDHRVQIVWQNRT